MGQKDSKKMTGREKQIVIGIDFGSGGITFAYGFLDDLKKEVFPGKFEEQGIRDKVSTEIILDDELNVKCFGNECNSYISSISGDKKYHHFKNIKMNLYKRVYTIKANNSDKEVDIQKIITIILKEVKTKALEQIKLKILDLDEKNIHWVITVPAIWENKSKQIMINAAQEAGLMRDDDDPSNFFALEPEAASIYYHNSKHAIENDDIDKGKPFILCDLGSGTVDIVTQKKKKEDNEIKFEELYPPVGGDYGCNKINEYFMDRVIKKLFGENNFNKIKKEICNKNYNDWYKFEEEIEKFKTSYRKDDQLKKFFVIDCDIFNEHHNEEYLKKLINDYNNNLKNKSWELEIDRSWKIKFPYNIINDLMYELMNNIISKYINPILESIDVKTLVFTGGASSNPILFNMIKEGINSSDLNLNYVKSPNPEVAIAFGSVLYSYDHFIISPRKAKYNFGINSTQKWDKDIHKNGGVNINDRCVNWFSKFITKDENLRPDQEICKIYNLNSQKATIRLYRTKENNAKFIDEKDINGEPIVHKFAEYMIDVGDKYDKSCREVEVKMKLGGTFISSSAIYKKTGKEAKITCLYEDEK